jgi:hypothetical protein
VIIKKKLIKKRLMFKREDLLVLRGVEEWSDSKEEKSVESLESEWSNQDLKTTLVKSIHNLK